MKASAIMVGGVYVRACGQLLKVEGLGNGRVCYSVASIGMMRTDFPRYCTIKTFAAKVRWDFSRVRRDVRAVIEGATLLKSRDDADGFEALRTAVRHLPFASAEAICPR